MATFWWKDDLLVLDIIGGAPSNVLGYLKIFQRLFYIVLGLFSPKITFRQKIQKCQIPILKLCDCTRVGKWEQFLYRVIH